MSTEPDAGAAAPPGARRDFIDEFCLEAAEQAFEDAARFLSRSKGLRLSQEQKLRFYGLFKQATAGPCRVPKPGLMEMVKRAKWTAWSGLGEMSKDDAITQYLAELEDVAPSWKEDQLESDLNDDGEDGGAEPQQSGGMGAPVVSTMAAGEDEAIDDGDKTVFHWAAEGRVERVREMLRAAGEGAAARADGDGLTALHWAADRNRPEVVRALVTELGADVNQTDGDGMTALHYAVMCEEEALVRLLLELGADPAVGDAVGAARDTSAAMAALF